MSNESKRIAFRAPINGYTGYGLHSCQIISDLSAAGYELEVLPTDVNESFVPIPANVTKYFTTVESQSKWELLLHPPTFTPAKGKKTVYFTMWESSLLPRGCSHLLNRAECVIVPSQWNVDCLLASGVERPIHKIPLGITTEAFRHSPMNMDGPCVFGTAGRTQGGGMRKGISRVMEVFLKAFPHERDVRLFVKVFPDCAVPDVNDPRIHITRAYFSESEISDWLGSLTCFVSLSRGEGWGLLQHQALAKGRPLVSIQFGGVAEFFNDEVGYPLRFDLEPAGEHYTGCGDCALPNEGDCVDAMREIYKDRYEASRRGLRGSALVSNLSWKRSNAALLRILQSVEMVK